MCTFKICKKSFDWTSKCYQKVVSYGVVVAPHTYSRQIRHQEANTDLISIRLEDQLIPAKHKYRPIIAEY